MIVPASLTNSALMPWGLPSSLTRARKAGGNEYSRPHSRPTFIAVTSHVVGARRLLDAVAGFVDHRTHHRAQIAGFAVDAELPIGTGSVAEQRPHILHFRPAPEPVHHV